jgi:queuine tRNA-ribosyltransferase
MTMHNLRFYQNLMQGLRDAIGDDSLESFVSDFLDKQSSGIL